MQFHLLHQKGQGNVDNKDRDWSQSEEIKQKLTLTSAPSQLLTPVPETLLKKLPPGRNGSRSPAVLSLWNKRPNTPSPPLTHPVNTCTSCAIHLSHLLFILIAELLPTTLLITVNWVSAIWKRSIIFKASPKQTGAEEISPSAQGIWQEHSSRHYTK